MWFTDHQEDTKCLGEEDRKKAEKNQRRSKLAVLNYSTVLPCSTCASRDKKKELLESLMSFTGRHKSICGQPKAEDTELVNELLCVYSGKCTDTREHWTGWICQAEIGSAPLPHTQLSNHPSG